MSEWARDTLLHALGNKRVTNPDEVFDSVLLRVAGPARNQLMALKPQYIEVATKPTLTTYDNMKQAIIAAFG